MRFSPGERRGKVLDDGAIASTGFMVANHTKMWRIKHKDDLVIDETNDCEPPSLSSSCIWHARCWLHDQRRFRSARRTNTMANTGYGQVGSEKADPAAAVSDGTLLDRLRPHVFDRSDVRVRTEPSRLVAFARRAEQVHPHHPERPEGLVNLQAGVGGAVESHQTDEEHIPFPLIRTGRRHLAPEPTQLLLRERVDDSQGFRRIRALTRVSCPRDHACASLREFSVAFAGFGPT